MAFRMMIFRGTNLADAMLIFLSVTPFLPTVAQVEGVFGSMAGGGVTLIGVPSVPPDEVCLDKRGVGAGAAIT